MRLELTKRTDLAMRAMTALAAEGGGTVKGSVLAEALDTSTHYLPQVMKPLVSEGWVASEPGPTGGYRTTAGAAEVSVFDLIEAVEGPFEDNRCVLRGAPCPAKEECALHKAWSRARSALVDELQRTQVVEFAADSHQASDTRRETRQ